jgi:hypothetical protein
MIDNAQLFPKILQTKDLGRNARVFDGSGNSVLLTPGLQLVQSIEIDGVELPLEIEEAYVSSATGQTESVTIPLIQTVHVAEGIGIQRSVKSNDGVWQAGSRIVVVGVWDDTPASAQPQTLSEALHGDAPSFAPSQGDDSDEDDN